MFTAKPLTGAIGAEIQGVQLADIRTPDMVRELRDLLSHYEVIFFRDQELAPQQQAALGERLGTIVKTVVQALAEPAPGVTVLDVTDPKGIADEWHSDQSYTDRPPTAAMLYAVMIPPIGGDTLWASMTKAYDDLSEPMKAMLDRLTATHSTDRLVPRMQATMRKSGKEYDIPRAAADHPLVRVHPETGRKLLYVSPLYTTRINELTEAESDAVLSFLFAHVTSPQYQVRFKWRERSAVIWDERSTIHYAVADYTERRIMHRLMLEGDRPVGVC